MGDGGDLVRAAEREERERRRAEARKYPIDDTELLAELRDKARAEGTPSHGPPSHGPLCTSTMKEVPYTSQSRLTLGSYAPHRVNETSGAHSSLRLLSWVML